MILKIFKKNIKEYAARPKIRGELRGENPMFLCMNA